MKRGPPGRQPRNENVASMEAGSWLSPQLVTCQGQGIGYYKIVKTISDCSQF